MKKLTANLLNQRLPLFSSFAVFLMAWSIQSGHAADVYWTNTAGGNWSASANWSPQTVPTAADNVFFVSNGNYTVALDVNAAVLQLTAGGASGQQYLTA